MSSFDRFCQTLDDSERLKPSFSDAIPSGLVVNWWITHAPQMGTCGEHWAIESGILYQKGQNGEACDAILVEGQLPKGIVEVELGVNESKKEQKRLAKYFSTMDKIGEYFKSSEYDFSSSQFGMFFAYSEGLKEATRNDRLEQLVDHGIKLSQDFPQQQQLFILWLDTTHEVPKLGRWDLKSQCGKPIQIRGALIQNGEIREPRICTIWPIET